MRHKMLQVGGERLALFVGFAPADSVGEGHVAEMKLRIGRRRKGEHVGRPSPAAKALVEAGDGRVVGQQDGEPGRPGATGQSLNWYGNP